MRRINLLPPEIEQKRRARQATTLLIGIGVAWVLILLVIWLVRQGELHGQEDRLAAAQADAAELQTKIGALKEFDDLDKAVKAKEASLAAVMADDVAWSRLLIELSMIIPGDSWLTSFSGTAAAATPPPPSAVGVTTPGYGGLSFSTVTFDFPGVAKWLTRLRELQSVQNIWVPSAAKGQIGTREVVNFSSSMDLSGAALSKRYQQGGP